MSKIDPYKLLLNGQEVGGEWFDLRSPLPATVQDPDDMAEFIRRFSIVPAYGTTERSSHSFLQHLSEVTRLSPSFNSALGDINSYAFGLNFSLVEPGVPGLGMLSTEREEVGTEERLRFGRDLSNLGIKLPRLIKLSQIIHRHLRACGNAYLRIYRAGNTYAIKPLHFTQAAYLRTLDPPYQFLVISKKWTEDYIAKYPPEVLPVTYPGDDQLNWITQDGVDMAVIHFKREIGSDWSEYYGRTEILAGYDWLAADIFGASVISKIAATEITAKNIFAFQAPNPNAIRQESDDEEFFAIMGTLRELTTAEGGRGKAKALAGFEYPWGSDAPTKLTLDVARDTDFAQFTQDYAANSIYALLNWSTQLSGFREVRTGLGSNVLRDLLITKQVSTIEPLQHEFENYWNWLIGQMLDEQNYRAERYDLMYQDTVTSMIEKLGDGPLSQSSPENTILNDPVN